MASIEPAIAGRNDDPKWSPKPLTCLNEFVNGAFRVRSSIVPAGSRAVAEVYDYRQGPTTPVSRNFIGLIQDIPNTIQDRSIKARTRGPFLRCCGQLAADDGAVVFALHMIVLWSFSWG